MDELADNDDVRIDESIEFDYFILPAQQGVAAEQARLQLRIFTWVFRRLLEMSFAEAFSVVRAIGWAETTSPPSEVIYGIFQILMEHTR